jgi:hypothetical protein
MDSIGVTDAEFAQRAGFVFSSTQEFDRDTRPEKGECWSDQEIRDWKNDEWYFIILTVTVNFNGADIAERSLGGIPSHYPDHITAMKSELKAEATIDAVAFMKKARDMYDSLR